MTLTIVFMYCITVSLPVRRELFWKHVADGGFGRRNPGLQRD